MSSGDTKMTPIQEFYANANVLVTGGTGFLGRALIEKLLRSCDVSTIYVLVRCNSDGSPQTRIDELIKDVIFDALRKSRDQVFGKIVAIGGDCALPGLGIEEADRVLLKKEVSIVFHAAATVKFNESLKKATEINIRATRDLLRLCKEMENLKGLVHVSTAFSNCNRDLIEEKFYSVPIDPDRMIAICENLSEDLLDELTPRFLSDFPNVYIFTKALAENLVKKRGCGLPVVIFRPSIIISTYKEPIKGWVRNLEGPAGVIAAASCGMLRSFHCDAKIVANVVPVDVCANALIAIPWHVENYYETEISIYQCESSRDCPIMWGDFIKKTVRAGLRWPTSRAIWYYSFTVRNCRVSHFAAMVLVHFLPGLVIDFVLFALRKKPRMLKLYRKVYRLTSVLSYFTTKSFNFNSIRMRLMLSDMTNADKEIFPCDLKTMDWTKYFCTYFLGIRLHVLNDPMTTLSSAKKKWNRLFWMHHMLQFFVICAIVYILRLVFMWCNN